MNLVSRTITGGVMIALGLILILAGFFTMFFTLFYGIPILIIGFFIFFNKKEDEIEKIKLKGGKFDLIKWILWIILILLLALFIKVLFFGGING